MSIDHVRRGKNIVGEPRVKLIFRRIVCKCNIAEYPSSDVYDCSHDSSDYDNLADCSNAFHFELAVERRDIDLIHVRENDQRQRAEEAHQREL